MFDRAAPRLRFNKFNTTEFDQHIDVMDENRQVYFQFLRHLPRTSRSFIEDHQSP